MSITITKSVGRDGGNVAVDVTAVQTQLNKVVAQLGLAPLAVNGTADPATIAAIAEFQRCIVKMKTPDGRIDPGGGTLKALNEAAEAPAAPAPAAPAPATPATATPAKVRYSDSLPASARLVSDYAFKVIEKAVVAAGIKAAVITSTLRPPAEQAAIMYDKASQNLDAQYALYGAAGDKVLDVFKANQGKPKPTVVALMKAKIDELGAQGVRVSLHVVSLEAYAKLNVIDIGVNSTRAVAGPAFNIAKITAAFNKLASDGYIRKFIDETAKANNCWHVEIVPGVKPL